MPRRCGVRELTNKIEETLRGPAAEIHAQLAERQAKEKELKGEFVVVVSGEGGEDKGADDGT